MNWFIKSIYSLGGSMPETNPKSLRTAALFILCMGFTPLLHAGKVVYSKKIQASQLTATTCGSGTAHEVKDVITTYWPSSTRYKSTLRIGLEYTAASQPYFANTWIVEIKYKLESKDKDGNTVHSCSPEYTLKIDYDRDNPHIDKDVHVYEDLWDARLFITGVTITSHTPALNSVCYNDDIIINMELECYKYRASIIGQVDPTYGYIWHHWLTANKQFEFRWGTWVGAEEYQIEWCFVPEQSPFQPTTASDIPDRYFTRVTLPAGNTSYLMQDHFDDGRIYYRIRAVGRLAPDYEHNYYTPWDDGSNQILDKHGVPQDFKLLVTNPEPEKNWTYQAGFSEEGKVKEVVSYFDGSGRNRQAITRVSTEGSTIVSESFYDYEGRAVLQTLPAPPKENLGYLKYYENFTLNASTGLALLKKDYDKDLTNCTVDDLELDDFEGAANYYSPSNGKKSQAFNAFIPDAEGYPYQRTVYDRSGRVSQASMPGATHKIGGGHETKQFYATPLQTKLDRLFGTEVGFAAHYRLNATVDPNGQMSIQYLNLSGQTIATSMVGVSPENLTALPSNAPSNALTASFNSHNQYSEPDGGYVIQTTFLAESAGEYDFTYEMTSEQYDALCGIPGGNCKYKLLLALFDDCNQPLIEDNYDSQNPILHTWHSIDGTQSPYTYNFTITISEPGVYTVKKILTLDMDELDALIAYYQEELPGNCFDLEELIGDYIGAIDWSNCDDCEEDCGDEIDVCVGLLEALLHDMSPGGQYFEGENQYTPSANWYDWLNTYIGNPEDTDNGITTPAYSDWGSHSDWQDVKDNWDPLMAQDLVTHHPEYCHYTLCLTLEASSEWNIGFLAVTTAAAAKTAGYLPSTITNCGSFEVSSGVFVPMDSDPFYINLAGTAQVTEMEDALAQSGCFWSEAGNIAGTDEDLQWTIFKGMYMNLKSEHIRDYKRGQGCECHCDGNNPPDLVADNCGGTPSKAVGYYISYGCPENATAYGGINAGSSQQDIDDAVQDLENFMQAACAGTKAWISTITDPLGCSSSTAHMRLDGVVISNTFNPIGLNPTALAQAIVNAINGHSAGYIATHLGGSSYEVKSPSVGTLDNGAVLQFYCGTGSGTVITEIGTLQWGAYPLEGCAPVFNCVCNEINLLFDNLTDPDGYNYTTTEAYEAIRDYYNNQYSTSYTATDIENWHTLFCTGGDMGENPLPDEFLYLGCAGETPEPPCDEDPQSLATATFYAEEDYLQKKDSLLQYFIEHYLNQCFRKPAAGSFTEDLYVVMPDYEYHYTLYYYDQAGNLTRTVPPAGVELLENVAALEVDNRRNFPSQFAFRYFTPYHNMVTRYEYNSLGELTRQLVPDADEVSEINLSVTTSVTGFASIRDMSRVDEKIIYASGLSKDVRKSLDGGVTWSTITLPSAWAANTHIFGIDFFDENIGIIAARYGYLSITFDGGATWTDVTGIPTPGPTQTTMQKVRFVTKDKAFACSVDGIYTININHSGLSASVTSTHSPANFSFRDIHVVSPDFVLFGCRKTANPNAGAWLYRYDANHGTPFATYGTNFGTSGATARAILAKNRNEIIVGASSTASGYLYVYKTTNAGQNWTQVKSTTSVFDYGKVEAFDSERLVVTGGTGIVLISRDYGDTWDDLSFGSSTYYTSTKVNGREIRLYGPTGHYRIADLGQHENAPFTQRYYYDRLGRPKASQDARQYNLTDKAYSYTAYDALGRPFEAGELENTNPPTTAQLNNTTWPASWTGSANHRQVTYSQYDEPLAGVSAYFPNGQQHLRGRVASAYYKDLASQTDYLYASHYSYDVHGNVSELIQENTDLTFMNQSLKHLRYEYDLISGNVLKVVYQQGELDQFMHRYGYDADNRIVRVETSRYGHIWDMDAKYFYYQHGPLARAEIGHHKVQGIDYAYTIHGWLKGVNANVLNPDNDMGKDGYWRLETALHPYNGSQTHHRFARDAYGFTLGYYTGDYDAILATHGNAFLSDISSLNSNNPGKSLYNGNIRHQATALMKTVSSPPSTYNNILEQLHATVYEYDQLNRLVAMDAWNNGYGTLAPQTLQNRYAGATNSTQNYKTRYSYDANGNLLTLERRGNNTAMDELTYHYSGSHRNRLGHVTDAITHTGGPDLPNGQTAGNYSYNANGQLTADEQEEIEEILWRADGKVQEVKRESTSQKPDLEFKYDPMGQRIAKIEKTKETNGNLKPAEDWNTTYYVRDAQGNVMSVYKQKTEVCDSEPCTAIILAEQHIYGSSRLGLRRPDATLVKKTQYGFITLDETDFLKFKRKLGGKEYELTNHLGNVMAVVTDRKITVQGSDGSCSSGSKPMTDFYIPNVVSYSDYYPGGMQMPGRNDATTTYRYGGAGGQETESEITGSPTHYSAEYWMYDSRLIRRWNQDPVVVAWESPYAAFRNNPIYFIDPNGDFADDYGVTDDGHFILLEKNDKPDRVFKINNAVEKKKVDIDGDGNSENDYVELKDKKIIPELNKSKSLNGKHYRRVVGGQENARDMFKLFLFLSDNTNVEWAISRAKIDDKNQFSLVTNNEAQKVLSPTNFYKPNEIIGNVHSHPNVPEEDALNSMGVWSSGDANGDWAIHIRDREKGYDFKSYVYFPSTTKLRVIGYHNKEEFRLIRKIEGNYERFFFGVLYDPEGK